jgi:hypothetical protein
MWERYSLYHTLRSYAVTGGLGVHPQQIPCLHLSTA